MSLGYAERLSFKEDVGGTLGAPEIHEAQEQVEAGIAKLAQLVREAKKVIVFTGAGISTSAGIPDFRGPSGVWTLQHAGKPLPRASVSFANATPTLTHQAILALHRKGKVAFVASQNVDGLHRRSGLPPSALAELHGNCFLEKCRACGALYTRDFEVETVGLKRTGRRCTAEGCRGALHDMVLDWDDALPVEDLWQTEQHSKYADLAICLGTSLQIRPACNLPLRTTRVYKDRPVAGKLAIVNLQRTQHDGRAARSGGVVVRAPTNTVLAGLARALGLALPAYERRDAVRVLVSPRGPWKTALVPGGEQGAASARMPASVSVALRSSHGDACPLPFVRAVVFALVGADKETLWTCEAECEPFQAVVKAASLAPGTLVVSIAWSSDLGSAKPGTIELPVLDWAQAHCSTHSFLTQRVEYGAQSETRGRMLSDLA